MSSTKDYEQDLSDRIIMAKNQVLIAGPSEEVVEYESGKKGVLLDSPHSVHGALVRWDNGEVEKVYIRHSASPPNSHKIVLSRNYREILDLEQELSDFSKVDQKINWNEFLVDLAGSFSDQDIMDRHEINEDQYKYLMRHPRVKLFFS